jgi:hypothetical protein
VACPACNWIHGLASCLMMLLTDLIDRPAGDRDADGRGARVHPKRGRAEAHEARAAVPAPAVREPVPHGAPRRARPHREDGRGSQVSEPPAAATIFFINLLVQLVRRLSP